MPVNQNWNYPEMQRCAAALRSLREDSILNKSKLDNAMSSVTLGLNAEAGQALLQAYQDKISSIDLFHLALEKEASLLTTNITYMQDSDRQLAMQIRNMFNK